MMLVMRLICLCWHVVVLFIDTSGSASVFLKAHVFGSIEYPLPRGCFYPAGYVLPQPRLFRRGSSRDDKQPTINRFFVDVCAQNRRRDVHVRPVVLWWPI